MTDAPRVSISVVIPCFNSAATLPALLESLENQTLGRDRYEIILVDDGSDDDSCQVARRYGGVAIHRQDHRGSGAAREAGMALAGGELVLYLDADAYAAPDLLEQHVQYHRGHPQVAATGGSVLPAGPYGIMSWQMVDHLSSWFNCHPRSRYSAPPEYLPSLNFCVKKDLVQQHQVSWADGLAHSGEDVLFCHDLRRQGLSLAFVPAAVLCHHDRPTAAGHLRHMRRWGEHAPYVRGRLPSLRYSFLFPRSRLKLAAALPLIVLGYTALIAAAWLRAKPLTVLLCLPQIFLGRLAYAGGVWTSTTKRPPVARASRP
ncbi:MAG: glycosyltransferase family 2 protein [Planctomycetaceae bacterium]|nr:glycosyltransferase family 2 protein [Planctomycetaceae bacterium]